MKLSKGEFDKLSFTEKINSEITFYLDVPVYKIYFKNICNANLNFDLLEK